jgi:tRNA U34 5-methylaminomethyl-2-thiouridine-forming methyltransferase MnmC
MVLGYTAVMNNPLLPLADPGPLVAVETGDGSFTLKQTDGVLHYRCLQGARTESRYVFLEGSGLIAQPAPWTVLELGLGSGLNFLTTADAFLKQFPEGELHYHTLDHLPLAIDLFRSLHPERNTDFPELVELLAEVLVLGREQDVVTRSFRGVHLTLYATPWDQAAVPADLNALAAYHDPFGPRQNPECWTPECFAWVAQRLAPEGRLATYAAASEARKAMAEVGLWIATRKGSGFKREMTIAAHRPELLDGLKLVKRVMRDRIPAGPPPGTRPRDWA